MYIAFNSHNQSLDFHSGKNAHDREHGNYYCSNQSHVGFPFRAAFVTPFLFQRPLCRCYSLICAYPTGKSSSAIRIFLDTPTLIPGTRHSLPTAECSHIRARRLQPGTNITLLNGRGSVATAVLHDDASVTILSNYQKLPQAPVVSAVIGLPKSPQRTDWLVEKLAELSAHRITFCNSVRTVAKKPAEGKIDRWRRVSIAATKQCLRYDVPHVEYVSTFDQVVTMVKHAQLSLLLSAGGKPLLAEGCLCDLKNTKEVLVLAGPEGGFSEGEEQLLLEAGAKLISLGDNRLRVETAIVVATAVVSQISFLNSCGKGLA